jgi:hypothetical protein
MQLHRVEPHLHTVRLRVFGKRPIGRKQKELRVVASVFVKGFDLPIPSFMLAIVDLAEIQHLALHHLTAATSLVLDNIPIAMLFPVFEASIENLQGGPKPGSPINPRTASNFSSRHYQ